MNLHMTRRLETLAKEIAAAKKPKIDAAANAAFEQIAQKPTGKTIGDLKSNDALKKSEACIDEEAVAIQSNTDSLPPRGGVMYTYSGEMRKHYR